MENKTFVGVKRGLDILKQKNFTRKIEINVNLYL